MKKIYLTQLLVLLFITSATFAQNSKPDLAISDEDIVLYSNLVEGQTEEDRHLVNNSSSIVIKRLKVHNNGEIASPTTKVTFYVSKDKTLNINEGNKDNNDVKLKEVTLASVRSKGYKPFSSSIFVIDFHPKLKNGEYYLLAVVDSTDAIEETNEENNQFEIPITYECFNNKPKQNITEDAVVLNDEAEVNADDTTYEIEILTHRNEEVLKAQVTNKEEEKIIINDLRKGLYIVKSKHGVRRIYTE